MTPGCPTIAQAKNGKVLLLPLMQFVHLTMCSFAKTKKNWTPINRNNCLTVGSLPPLSPPFSTADTHHRSPQVTDVRDQGVPFDTTFTTSAHCKGAANAARRLLLLVRRAFCELSMTAFTPLYCAFVRPHLEYALWVDINKLERAKRLATRLTSSWPSKC